MKIFTLFILAIASFTRAQAEEWRFGSVSIQWLDGFKKTPGRTAERFVGPKKEIVLVTVMGLTEGGDREKMTKAYLDFGETQLPQLSRAKGKDAVEPSRKDLGNGRTLFLTAASQERDQSMFYLQFLVVSNTGRCAFFTVEGSGNPTEELETFRPLFDSISWDQKVD